MSKIGPTLHRDFRIDEKVWFDAGDGSTRHGQIIGISGENTYFKMYIILLDEPLQHPDYPNQKPWRGLIIPGSQLRSKFLKDDIFIVTERCRSG